MSNFVRLVFYGNIFYGLCAIAMCIETNFLLGIGLNHFPFYLLIFFGTWMYYTMIYIRSTAANADKEINDWYRHNLRTFKYILAAVIWLQVILLSIFVWWHFTAITHLSGLKWALLASVPLAGALYTFKLPVVFLTKFRQVGWLKPFIIGITWSGWVTLYPAIIYQIQYNTGEHINKSLLLLWLVNFLFITVLAIIFDVKDYNTDVQKDLKTYPAQLGISNTFRYIIIPATVITIIVALCFQIQQAFTFAQIIIQLLPLLLLLVIVMMPARQHKILYYLVIIDGLMLLKAISNIISIQYL